MVERRVWFQWILRLQVLFLMVFLPVLPIEWNATVQVNIGEGKEVSPILFVSPQIVLQTKPEHQSSGIPASWLCFCSSLALGRACTCAPHVPCLVHLTILVHPSTWPGSSFSAGTSRVFLSQALFRHFGVQSQQTPSEIPGQHTCDCYPSYRVRLLSLKTG